MCLQRFHSLSQERGELWGLGARTSSLGRASIEACRGDGDDAEATLHILWTPPFRAQRARERLPLAQPLASALHAMRCQRSGGGVQECCSKILQAPTFEENLLAKRYATPLPPIPSSWRSLASGLGLRGHVLAVPGRMPSTRVFCMGMGERYHHHKQHRLLGDFHGGFGVLEPGYSPELQHQLLCKGLFDHFAARNCQTLPLHLVFVGRVLGCP
mmetsp:Transcript_43194/g.93861  ORF Transcript_43194/g.93861 Transcript_43194/m.93861 type:complete len:214 (+) Transcript_43194:247-888(+)